MYAPRALILPIHRKLGMRTENREHAQDDNAAPNIIELNAQYLFQKIIVGKKKREVGVDQPINHCQAKTDEHHVISNGRTPLDLFFMRSL